MDISTITESSSSQNTINELLSSTVSSSESTAIASVWNVSQFSTESISDVSDKVFQSVVVVIGATGTAANGFVASVLIAFWRKSKLTTNALLMNQLLVDLFSCSALMICYVVRLCNAQLIDSQGYYICLFLLSEVWIWSGIDASSMNLSAIAIERYLQVCHPFWHKAYFRPWMVYAAISVVWSSGLALNFGSTLPTTDVVDGECFALTFWQSNADKFVFGVWYYLSTYAILIVIFGFCYGRIFVVISHQRKLSPADTILGPNEKLVKQKQLQMKLLKTAVLLTLSYAICWMPNQLYYLLQNTMIPGLSENNDIWSGTVSLGFCNICINPFIYGTKSELVRDYFGGRLANLCHRKNQISGSRQQEVENGTAKKSARSLALRY